MKVKKLLHTRMRVSDMDQTITFYTQVLGLEVLERHTSPRGSHLAFLSVPNSEELIELCSFPPSGPVKVQEDLVHLAFQVDNLDETISALNSKGVRITDSCQGQIDGRMARTPARRRIAGFSLPVGKARPDPSGRIPERTTWQDTVLSHCNFFT